MIPLVVLWCGIASGVPSDLDWQTYRDTKARAGRDAHAHLRLALWCGERGMAAERRRHLATALVIAPNDSTARALLGYVREDGQWRKRPADEDGDAASLDSLPKRSEYLAKRSIAELTVPAQWQLVLWCEKQGMKPEALAHAEIVVRLDPKHELAWGRLGFRKHEGRFMTAAQIAAENVERDAQARADRKWYPMIARARDRLREKDHRLAKERRTSADDSLAAITDPRAVPSVWRALGAGSAVEQAYAVQVLGQIDSREPSRALAVLSVFGSSVEVRRTATETLGRRDPHAFADVLVALLRDPVRYEIVPVRTPGVPGALRVEGTRFIGERLYVSPPPPNIAIFPGETVTFDAAGLPVLHRHTDTTGLPFAWDTKSGFTIPSGAVVAPHIPVSISLGRMWVENWKSAASAQRQLANDTATIEGFNEALRAANSRVARVLNDVTRQSQPADPETWRRWSAAQLGRTYTPEPQRARPVVSEIIGPAYLPANVSGLGFDPVAGYYVRIFVPGW
jgi:hypothetical protein